MSEWIKTQLSECCISISDGDHQPPPKAENGIPFITISNMTSTNQIDFSDTLYVPQEYYDGLDSKRKARKDDILYSVVGSFGIPIFMKEDKEFVFQRHIAILRPQKEKIVPRFLYYTMLTRDFYAKADAAAIGAAQRTVSLTALRNMEVFIPDLKQQEKIVDILVAYDDMIENNQKQINLLEEMAQRLYKEWFVDLRFPGHENADYVDGIPMGWRKGTVGNLFKTVLGGTPSREKPEYWRGNIPWINSGEVNKLRIIKESEFITENGLKNSSTKLMPLHTTVLAITGATLGQVSYTEIETCANQSVVGVYDEEKQYSEYIYLCISNEIKKIIAEAIGGAQQHINKEVVNKFEILLPDAEVNEMMKKTVVPAFSKITNLYLQIEKLSESRDRLLSKLMSGEIEL